jgi:antirestriction protein ArdC
MGIPPSTFATLLEQAVHEPGILSNAYRAFHNYSIGNQLLAWSQCLQRGIQPGPIATFQRWRELGRYVRKGEKALTLCRPVTVKRTSTADDGTEEITAATWFVYKPFWFVLAQTDGQPFVEAEVSAWETARALAALDVQERLWAS